MSECQVHAHKEEDLVYIEHLSQLIGRDIFICKNCSAMYYMTYLEGFRLMPPDMLEDELKEFIDSTQLLIYRIKEITTNIEKGLDKYYI